ncbi:MAG: hypothetical protein AB7W59_14130 [Acidimicrobiia bacterium]
MASHRATFTRDQYLPSWLYCDFPYDPDYVEAIKKAVPGAQRSWDPKAKRWAIHCNYRLAVEQAFEWVEMCRPITGGSRQQWDQQRRQHTPPPKQQPTSNVQSLEDVLVTLFRMLPPDLRPKAHKALVRTVHPDAGGTHELAVSVNRAWDKAVAA